MRINEVAGAIGNILLSGKSNEIRKNDILEEINFIRDCIRDGSDYMVEYATGDDKGEVVDVIYASIKVDRILECLYDIVNDK
ncbi:hypothetical protein RS523_004619 [Salmonella enterica]|nr:hypothetical protein [Salmonella enterica]ELJ6085767.1 hypothetical protein [Salmonella enterica]